MENITLTADDDLIAAARERAGSENTALNERFRIWLAGYARQQRLQQYEAVMVSLHGQLVVSGKLSRDETRMSVDLFIDTNVFTYQLDARDAREHAVADNMVGEALADETACISFQVVQECLDTVLRKADIALDKPSALTDLDTVLAPLHRVRSTRCALPARAGASNRCGSRTRSASRAHDRRRSRGIQRDMPSPRIASPMAFTACCISLRPIAPIQPTRKVSTCVSLPGYKMKPRCFAAA